MKRKTQIKPRHSSTCQEKENTMLRDITPLGGNTMKKKISGFSLLLIAAMLLAPTTAAHAALVLDENFDYGDSNITGTTAFGGWNANLTSNITYNTTDLAFTHASYEQAGNVAATGTLLADSGRTRAAQREFTTGAETGTFWLSGLVNANSTTSVGFVGLSLHSALMSSPQNRFHADAIGLGYQSGVLRPFLFKQDGTETIWGSLSGNEYDVTTTLSPNTTYLLLANVTVGAGADSLDFWVKAEGDTFGTTVASLGTPNFSKTDRHFGESLRYITAGGTGTQDGALPINGYFDAIRISSLQGDAGLTEVLTTVIPEPATVTLLVLGAAVMLPRRRKA